jgi:hypothetical protein
MGTYAIRFYTYMSSQHYIKVLQALLLMRSFITRTLKYNWNDQVNKDEMDGHVARMGRRGIHEGYWWESQKERNHWENQDLGVWTILKWILER